MKHTSQSEFGRAKRAVPDVLEHGPDKWALLQLLTETSDNFALSHRTLSVLKALLTFLPTRHIPDGPEAVVFPANKTLSHRLSGMPESTLRRHISQLIKAGIVSRQDSPNRKRFARHRAGHIAVAYGFDLSPLRDLAQTLKLKAATARETRERLQILRCQVMDMRALVLASDGQSNLCDEAAKLLRRRPDEQAFHTMINRLTTALETSQPTSTITDEMSVTGNENERHIQDELKYSKHSASIIVEDESVRFPTVQDVQNKCTAFTDFFPEKAKSWHDLLRISDQVAPMLGINQDLMNKARSVIDERSLSIVILCLLERFNRLESPERYFYSLIKLAERGSFRLEAFFRGTTGQIVS